MSLAFVCLNTNQSMYYPALLHIYQTYQTGYKILTFVHCTTVKKKSPNK